LGTRSGGNSLVHEIQVGNLILGAKQFIGDISRVEQSFSRELSSLRFLNENNFKAIPKLYYFDEDAKLIVMEYFKGEKPKANGNSLIQLVDFITSLKQLYASNSHFNWAIDAEESFEHLFMQVELRIEEMRLENENYNQLETAERILNRLDRVLMFDETENSLTYSVSDLGLHNSIELEGVLHFFDFEFFGKDHPYKVVSDFLLHPQNEFDNSENAKFFDLTSSIFGLNEKVAEKHLCILALKWALICLKRLSRMKQEGLSGELVTQQYSMIDYYFYLANTRGGSTVWDEVFRNRRF
jgi:hypothetical protein